MMRDLLANLHARRRAMIKDLAGRLAVDPDADIAATSREIEAVDRMIDHIPRPVWRRLRLPLAVAVLCLVAVWLGWTVRTDSVWLRTRVVLTTESSSVSFRTAENWDQANEIAIDGGDFSVKGAAFRFLDPSIAIGTAGEDDALDVHSGRIRLTVLNVQPGAEVTLERGDGNQVDLYLSGGKASGTLSMHGSIALEWAGPDDEWRPLTLAREVPETLNFFISQPPGTPAQIRFTPEGPFILPSLRVSHLSFGRERSTPEAGAGDFVSTVQKGRVSLTDVGTAYELWIGDHIVLDGLKGQLRELSVDDTITVTLEGTVERLQVGPPGDELDRTPNLITYLYNDKPLGFLFGAASFLWAALWSLWRLIGG